MRLVSVGMGALVSAFVVALGCSSPESSEPIETVQQEIQGGEPDTTSSFAVGVCSGSPGRCNSVCSGALILPNVVASARHCVDRSPRAISCPDTPRFGARNGGPLWVTTNPSMRQGAQSGGWYEVEEIRVPSDDRICGNDIALFILKSAVPAQVAKPITPGVQHVMWDSDRYGNRFAAIGYGNTGPDQGGSQERRIRRNIPVVCIPGAPVRACPDEVMEYMSPKEFWGGDGTCSGDSGSSAFERLSLANGAPVSFGVLSRGGEERPENGTPKCKQSFYTRFDAHRDFVLEVAEEASRGWTLYPEPSWTAYVAPPDPNQKKKDDEKEEPPAPKPPALGLGEACAASRDCESGLCLDMGDEDETALCSSSCEETEETTGCPEGFECSDSYCVPEESGPEDEEEPAAVTVVKTTGCSASAGAPASPWGLGLVLSGVLLAARRRRSGRRSSG